MGHKFSLVLNREITEEELGTLRESGCADAVFGTGELPANPEIAVTKMDFDDMASASLGEAIESAFKAVEKVSDLNVPCLTVPPQDEDELAEPAESVG